MCVNIQFFMENMKMKRKRDKKIWPSQTGFEPRIFEQVPAPTIWILREIRSIELPVLKKSRLYHRSIVQKYDRNCDLQHSHHSFAISAGVFLSCNWLKDLKLVHLLLGRYFVTLFWDDITMKLLIGPKQVFFQLKIIINFRPKISWYHPKITSQRRWKSF